MGQDFLVERIELECAVELLRYQGKVDAAEQLAVWEVPKFPVSGKTIQSPPISMKPGKQIGGVLRKLKDDWKASRFTLTEAELIHAAVALVPK